MWKELGLQAAANDSSQPQSQFTVEQAEKPFQGFPAEGTWHLESNADALTACYGQTSLCIVSVLNKQYFVLKPQSPWALSLTWREQRCRWSQLAAVSHRNLPRSPPLNAGQGYLPGRVTWTGPKWQRRVHRNRSCSEPRNGRGIKHSCLFKFFM